jgi:hypothetical protein
VRNRLGQEAEPRSPARSDSSARTRSSMSVAVPNRRATRPDSSHQDRADHVPR